MADDNILQEISDAGVGKFEVAPAHGIAALALAMAMKYHSINTVQDGVLYQQYKMEGKNMEPLSIHMVFETAMQIEAHLLASSDRIASIVVHAISAGIDADEQQPDEAAQ
jgi:hypothetical protein